MGLLLGKSVDLLLQLGLGDKLLQKSSEQVPWDFILGLHQGFLGVTKEMLLERLLLVSVSSTLRGVLAKGSLSAPCKVQRTMRPCSLDALV